MIRCNREFLINRWTRQLADKDKELEGKQQLVQELQSKLADAEKTPVTENVDENLIKEKIDQATEEVCKMYPERKGTMI